MKVDEFRAARFSLKESVNAIAAMCKIAALGAPATGKAGATSDEYPEARAVWRLQSH